MSLRVDNLEPVPKEELKDAFGRPLKKGTLVIVREARLAGFSPKLMLCQITGIHPKSIIVHSLSGYQYTNFNLEPLNGNFRKIRKIRIKQEVINAEPLMEDSHVTTIKKG